MLNIGKLGVGGEAYYLESVAEGIEDYYLGNGEAPGYWLGSGARALGLSGRVEAEGLHRVLAGLDPKSGDRLDGRSGARVPGWDLTFRAPKSVSLLYALAEPEVSAQVTEAHREAVAAAVGYLERTASSARRGAGGVRQIDTAGFIAGGFRHRTSRAGDPLLHTHVLVANLVQGADGRWSRLDARALFTQAKTAGYLYQAHLRAELTRRLGVDWEPVSKGTADVAGIDRSAIKEFSQRRSEILARMAERGESSAAAAQAATLDTRRAKDPRMRLDNPTMAGKWAKDYGVAPQDGPRLSGWRARAEAVGLTAEQLAGVRGRTRYQGPSAGDLRDGLAELLGPEGLTAQASTFSGRDAIQAWCNQLRHGADVAHVEALVEALLADTRAVRLDGTPLMAASVRTGDVIRLRSGSAVPSRTDTARYTTTELLAAERSIVEGALAGQNGTAGLAGRVQVDRAVAGSNLGADQEAMVRRLTSSGAGVEVVVGKAGTGKTFALNVARQAWETSGCSVRGAALAAKAAAGLQEGAGIASTTVDRLLFDLDRADIALDARSVVVVDEAGMVGTRKLARLLDHAQRARAKVVLVGDHHQLPEIDAGGAFRGLCNRLAGVELDQNHRQREGWERQALDQLRHGDVSAALSAYVDHDRLVSSSTAAERRDLMVGDWAAQRAEGRTVLMLAYRRVEVRDLNRAAQERRRHAGELGAEVCPVGGHDVAVGDEVLMLRNARRLGVTNGDRAVVAAHQPIPGGLRVTYGDGRLVELPRQYLADGHVTLGYATTVHKAQGATSDVTLTLASDRLFRELGYVAQSRGRADNRLYVVGEVDAQVRRLEHTLGRSRRQTLALDQSAPPPVTEERPSRPRSEPTETVSADIAGTYRAFERLDQVMRAAPPVRQAEWASAERELASAHRAVARAHDQTSLGDSRRRVAELSQEVKVERRSHEARQDWEREHDPDVVAYRQAAREIADWERRRLQQLRLDPPDYIRSTLGPRPTDRAGWRRWDNLALAMEQDGAGVTLPMAETGERPPPVEREAPEPVGTERQANNRRSARADLRDLSPGMDHRPDAGYSR